MPHVSALVVREAGAGDSEQARARLEAIRSFPVLGIAPNAERLARIIIEGHGVPAQRPEDALHIAIAVIGGMDFIVTWNFAHMNNPFTKTLIRQAVENEGYQCPELVSPDAFLGGET